MNIKITREFLFSMAHRLTDHQGKCRNLHGHTYKLCVTLEGSILHIKKDGMSGMVMDFAILKKIAGDILSEYDHRLLIWSADPIALSLSRLDPSVQVVDYNPTAENLCRILKAEFSSAIREEDPEVSVVEITLWETENSYASI